jgi:hypothetical protein
MKRKVFKVHSLAGSGPWCKEMFGKPIWLVTWDGNFANDTEDYCAFKFWDEQMATYLKLTYPELMTREEFDNKDYV